MYRCPPRYASQRRDGGRGSRRGRARRRIDEHGRSVRGTGSVHRLGWRCRQRGAALRGSHTRRGRPGDVGRRRRLGQCRGYGGAAPERRPAQRGQRGRRTGADDRCREHRLDGLAGQHGGGGLSEHPWRHASCRRRFGGDIVYRTLGSKPAGRWKTHRGLARHGVRAVDDASRFDLCIRQRGAQRRTVDDARR